MRLPRWAPCARFAAAALMAVATLNDPATAQATGNPAKLQKKLEAVAAKLSHEDLGPVKARTATVGDHMLTIDFEPAQGVDGALALKNMKELSWDHAICTNKDALAFISGEAVTIRVTLSRAGQATETIADVTAGSCAREATVDPSLSRLIDGISFAPKPSRDRAISLAQAWLKAHLYDADSAHVECGNVSEAAWVRRVLDRRHYGYFIECSVNAKNLYGAYTGAHDYGFRINGDDFEEYDDEQLATGLMESAK